MSELIDYYKQINKNTKIEIQKQIDNLLSKLETK